ncbi:DNA replication terminus site-binding protein [Ferrimonas pelagia]|uniref:DNA replication terminus site-binding protein n=1 Tax=Ferrimonas pelagia TaxID=1177826 RepID=A0ABP9FJ27_9GAMM
MNLTDDNGAMVALRQQFERCSHQRRTLSQTLSALGPSQSVQYALPCWLQTRPLDRIDTIPVETLSGSAAHQACVAALNDLHRKADDQQSQRVRRYPGVLRFATANALGQEIAALTQHLTEFKQQLHRLTEHAANVQDLRFELLHQLSPNLFTMHFYRTPVSLPSQVRRIRFGWVAKRIVAKIQRDELLQKLDNAMTNPGQSIMDMAAWQDNVARERERIASLPAQAQLRIDRPGGLRPTAFMQFEDGSRRQTPANLPLVLTQPQPVQVVDLPDWQQTAYPQAKGELLIARLHLYRID